MIKRDAFLYLDPRGNKNKFAQCETCMMWTGKHKTCTILGKEKEVLGTDSCGLYVHGKPHEDMAGMEMEAVTPKEAGFYSGQVRCENCKHFDVDHCHVFEELNEMEMFDLDEWVDAKGCCNAFEKMAAISSTDDLRKKRRQLNY